MPSTRIAAVQGDSLRGGGRRARRRRQEGRRAGGDRRLHRGRSAAGSSSRPRTSGCPSPGSTQTSTTRWSSATPTTRCSWCPRRGGAGQAALAARVPGRQDDRRLRPRGRVDARAGVRLPSRARAGCRGRARAPTRSTPRPCGRPWPARTPRWPTFARSSPAHARHRRHRLRPRGRRGARGERARRAVGAGRLLPALASSAIAVVAGRTRAHARERRTCRATLRQQQLVVRGLAIGPDRELERRDLLLHRPGGARAHLVAPGVQRLLDRRGVLRLDRARRAPLRTCPRASRCGPRRSGWRP